MDTKNITDFVAGHKESHQGYSYFVPIGINEQWVWTDPVLNDLLQSASVKLGELNSFAQLIPNIDLFIQLHVTKEAVVSSRIEGTRTNMDEAILPEQEIAPERKNDWREVNNYVRALNEAIAALDKLPISSRLLRQAHDTLMQGVRGADKMPGDFRTSQNWIGGRSLNDATFIPPHHKLVYPAMADLESFLHNDRIKVPGLVRVAMAHYQFETIHPFLDGNGRIGRLLITLYLVSEGILDQPLLYLSSFFDSDRQLYYDNLMRVREKNDMQQWLRYFLVGVEKTATQAVETLKQILRLKEDIERSLPDRLGRRSHSAQTLLQKLYESPWVNVEHAREITGLSYKAANDLIAAMVGEKWLREVTGQSRNRMFVFDVYLNAFRGD